MSDETPSTTPTRRNPGTVVLSLVIATVIVVGAIFIGRQFFGRADSSAPATSPSSSTSTVTTSASSATTTTPTSTASSSASSGAVPKGCSPTTQPMNDPKTFQIDDLKVKSPMLSLGLDDSGAAAAPPKNQARTVGWFNEGPKIGADRGNAVLTIHTYRQGGALGNQLYDPENGLKEGALVRITDAGGTQVCYTYERLTKVWVKDYDPNSSVLYDYEGKPQAVIVICWDFNKRTEAWDSRILYYLKPVAPAA